MLISCVLFVCVRMCAAQEGIGELPLPELKFQHEEEEPATEYLVNKPVGYLRFPAWEDAQQTAIDLGQPLHLGGGLWPGQEGRPSPGQGRNPGV